MLHALDSTHADLRAHDAVGGGDGQAIHGRDGHGQCGGQLSAVAAGGGHLGHLDAQHLDDVVAIGGQTSHNACTTQHQDPLGGRSLGGNLVGPVGLPDASKGSDGVGHVVGAVRKGHAARGEDLQVLVHVLRLGVKHLGTGVHGGNSLVLVHVLMHIHSHGVDHVLLDLGEQARHASLGRLLNLLSLGLAGLSILALLSLSSLLLSSDTLVAVSLPLEQEAAGDGQAGGAASHSSSHPAGLVLIPVQLILGTLVEHKEDVDVDGDKHQGGQGKVGEQGGVLAAQHQGAVQEEEDGRDDGGNDRRGEPGDHHRHQTLGVGELVNLLVPHNGTATTKHQAKAQHSANDGVGGGDSQLHVGGKGDPHPS
mmetsp:Transcript_17660/g.44471  ORF Transcript_17660/g.44471 Transcript_17660/m.44471 type:complete len:366 (+) Transcript_17660:749-1846(+)